MFRISNDAKRASTIASIEGLKNKREAIEKQHGKKKADLVWKAYRRLVEQMQEQVRQYDALRNEGIPAFKGSNLSEFGDYLVDARIAAGMTQEELAKRLGVSQPMIYKYEMNQYQGYSLQIIEKAAKALGVNLDLSAWRKFEKPVYSAQKQENLILYFLNRINNATLGRTKLMKLLYYVDFEFFEKQGRSITGDQYVAQPYGPVPQQAEALLKKMEKAGKLHSEKLLVRDREQVKYFAQEQHALSFFDKEEFIHIDNVAQRFECWTAGQMSNQTHEEYPWRVTRLGDPIDYRLVLSLREKSDTSS